MKRIKIVINTVGTRVILVGFKYCEHRQFSKLLFKNKSLQNITESW